MNYKGHFASKTDIGRVRVTNEDQATVLTNYHGDVFMVVCDGMGGQNKGDYASKMALDYLVEAFQNKRRTPMVLSRAWLRRAIKEANLAIFNEAERSEAYRSMGTTLVCVLIQGNKMAIANPPHPRPNLCRLFIPFRANQAEGDGIFPRPPCPHECFRHLS